MTEPSHLFDGAFAAEDRRHARDAAAHGGLRAAGRALAVALHRAGLRAGDRIGWIGPNDHAQLLLLAACARLGAIQVPLNWRLGVAELRAIEADAGFRMLAVPDGAARQAPFRHAYVEDFRSRHGPHGALVGDPLDWHDGHAGTDLAAEPAALPPRPAPGAPLLICYTSGTTGLPKGAVHTQAGMRAHAAMARSLFGITPADRVLTVLPMFHVGGLCIQTLPALLAGAALVLHPRFTPEAFFDSLEACAPTLTLLVPAVMRALVEHPRWGAADLSCLRAIGAGSSEVPGDLIAAFHAKGVPVQQVYGATETGPIAIAQSREEALAAPGSIGRPMPGVEARLAPGTNEILLRGPQLMRGYWNRTDGLDAEGWFATGDAGRVDAEGRWWFTGRIRHLIISGGENIHPAEIERVLATAPGVADCAVVGRPDPRWGEVPVAVVVPRAGFAEAAVRAHLDARLARFKQPRAILTLESLPRTALGKVALAELKAMVARS